MQVINKVKEWKNIKQSLSTKSIGFVPTMGNLHQGHASLIEKSVLENDITVLSIFVNPAQFNNKEDLANYPHTLEADITLASKLKVDYLLYFNEQELYPDGYNFRITENSSYSESMEGEFRPGHFTGMLTIVLKLLLLTNANKAYFGEKDYQQLTLVKNMAEAFLLDTEIIACLTIRNQDGLPLSSRNSRLSLENLAKAALFSRLLTSRYSENEVVQKLKDAGFEVDYIEHHETRRYGAVKLNGIRLIDNIEV
jgi:pantoate--beta-alanine ligase